MKDENRICRPDAGQNANNVAIHRTAKQRGDLAEIAFLYKASELGFGVAKPYCESTRYDFILSWGERLWRVQVKSTYRVYRRGYKVSTHRTSMRQFVAYTPKEIDILVAYIVPQRIYYVIPAVAVQGVKALCLYPSGTRKGAGQFEQYREAWHLMMPAANPAPAEPIQVEPVQAESSLNLVKP